MSNHETPPPCCAYVHTLSTTFLPLPLLSALYFASGIAVGAAGTAYLVVLSPSPTTIRDDVLAFLDTWTFTALLATGVGVVLTAAMGAATYSGEKMFRSLDRGTLWTPMHDKRFDFDRPEEDEDNDWDGDKEETELDTAVVYHSASGRKYEFA